MIRWISICRRRSKRLYTHTYSRSPLDASRFPFAVLLLECNLTKRPDRQCALSEWTAEWLSSASCHEIHFRGMYNCAIRWNDLDSHFFQIDGLRASADASLSRSLSHTGSRTDAKSCQDRSRQAPPGSDVYFIWKRS